MNDVLFQLLQVVTGKRTTLEYIPTSTQWRGLFEIVKRQALIGVCADAIEKLPENQRPPKDIALQWAFMAMKIEQRNRYLNDRILPICRRLNKDGFDVCLLKGQGVAEYYPNPLRRQSGDLDLWIIPKDAVRVRNINFGKCRDSVVGYAYRNSECTDLGLHHIDFPVFKDIPIELHFVPAYFHNYITNLRFDRWLRKMAKQQFDNVTALGVSCPEDSFNLVFLLIHIYKHFLFDGIGLRQIMDYYFLVKKWNIDGKLFEQAAMSEFYDILRQLKIVKFCGAVMWVLHRVLGLERSCMLVEPDVDFGEILLGRILSGGNFGQYLTDTPCQYKVDDGHLVRYYKHIRKIMRMFKYAPMEIICSPVRIIEVFLRIRIDRLKYRNNA